MNSKCCLFCGQPPRNKNREHVLPRWLIQLTGNPKRLANFGIDWNSGSLNNRKFSFDSFVFPACTKCNSTYSNLETIVKPIVKKMLTDQKITADEIELFLDWLDKVRVGIWLGLMALNKNHLQINPNFAITQRNALHDRVLFIFRGTNRLHGLTFFGGDSPLFQYMPSCFALRINHLFFLNASSDSLISKELGLPFPKRRLMRKDNLIECEMSPGDERQSSPVLPLPLLKSASKKFLQPFKVTDFAADVVDTSPLYTSNYVNEFFQKNSIRGRIIQTDGVTTSFYPNGESLDWRSPVSVATNRLVYDLVRYTADWQEKLWLSISDSHFETDEIKEFFQSTDIVNLHRILTKKCLDGLIEPPDVSTFD